MNSGLPVDAATCVRVGPVVHRNGSSLFAELACTTGGTDSPEQLLAIKPETDTTFHAARSDEAPTAQGGRHFDLA
jgi:hypothetical protein